MLSYEPHSILAVTLVVATFVIPTLIFIGAGVTTALFGGDVVDEEEKQGE